jgi:hypothetical protein
MSQRLRLFPRPVQTVEQLHMRPQPHSGVGIGGGWFRFVKIRAIRPSRRAESAFRHLLGSQPLVHASATSSMPGYQSRHALVYKFENLRPRRSVMLIRHQRVRERAAEIVGRRQADGRVAQSVLLSVRRQQGELEAEIHAVRLARERFACFQPEIDGRLQCPRCWIVNELRSFTCQDSRNRPLRPFRMRAL